jgi:2-methylcitrate dehydratase PrpD
MVAHFYTKILNINIYFSQERLRGETFTLAKQQEYTVERIFLNKFSSQSAIEKVIEMYIKNRFEEQEIFNTEIERGD